MTKAPSRLKTILSVTVGVISLALVAGAVTTAIWAIWNDVAKKDAKKNGLAYHLKMADASRRVGNFRALVENHIDERLLDRTLGPHAVRLHPSRPDPDDIEQIHAEFQLLEKIMRAVQDEIPLWTVPDPERDLHAKYLRLFDHQQKDMKKFHELLAILEDGRLSASEKNARGSQLLQEIRTAEQPLLNELQQAENEFGSNYGVMLVPGY